MTRQRLQSIFFISLVVVQAAIFLVPAISRADPPAPPAAPPNNSANNAVGGGSFVNPIQYDTIEDFLIAVLNALVLILFPIIVLMLVYCGFAFIAARGNEAKIKEARRVFFWTLIGGLIVLGAKALALAIAATVSEIQAGP